jgi:hypothetical protein
VLCATVADALVDSVTGEPELLAAIAAEALAEQRTAEEQAAADKHLTDTVSALLYCHLFSVSPTLAKLTAVHASTCSWSLNGDRCCVLQF